ncbi:MAG: TIGR00730 family Rossman fold protein [Bacteroidota bacterium]
MKSISVYCGSSSGSKGVYIEAAKKLGRILAERKIQLVFGGGKVGLMGIMADAALEAGGKVTGVIPRFLHVKEVAHDGLSKMITAETMHERKILIHEMSDAVIALPGGFGTLDELFEMLTWAQLGLHQKPVGILNVNGYFTHLLQAIDTMVDEGFLRPVNREIVLVSDNVDELLDKMDYYVAPCIPKWI